MDRDAYGARSERRVCDICCICLTHRAGAALGCRCSVPSVCGGCAQKLDKCPQCDADVEGDLWLHAAQSETPGNIFSIETAFSLRPVQLFVKGLQGQTFTVESFVEWDVGDFRKALTIATGIAASQQRIIARALQLSDGLALRDYGIGPEDTIHLLCRLRGD